MSKVIIIGGMAAGCKAAARLKRINPNFEVTIIEKRSFISYGACGMPLYASGDVDDFFDLAKTPWGTVRDTAFFRDAKGVNVMINTEALEIDGYNKTVACKNLKTDETFSIDYDYFLLATGARPLIPGFQIPVSENISTFHNPLDAKKFRQKAQTGQIGKTVIIGGGFIGVELAEATAGLWGIETHLIERENRLLPGALDEEISKVLETTLSMSEINLHLNSEVKKIALSEDGNPIVFLSDGEEIESDYLFICAGVKPDASLAQSAGIDIGEKGGITVDSQLRTNVPGIWAAGDCVETTNLITGKPGLFPLGSLANRQGKAAAESIAGMNTEYKGSVGAISVKVFEMIIASSGLSEKAAFKSGIKYNSVVGSWLDRPEYHPDVQAIFGKLVYEKKTMRLLGLQLAGKGEVTRYIDAFTAIASRGGTVKDLIDMEHAYTPPHSAPVNPLNHLGAMAEAQEERYIICRKGLYSETFEGNILDVREEVEIEAYPFPGAVRYTINEYKKHIHEFDKKKPLLIICQKGPRAYEAACFFKNSGYRDVSYLGGGIQLLNAILKEI